MYLKVRDDYQAHGKVILISHHHGILIVLSASQICNVYSVLICHDLTTVRDRGDSGNREPLPTDKLYDRLQMT